MALASELVEITTSNRPFVSDDWGRPGPKPLVTPSSVDRLPLLAEFGIGSTRWTYSNHADPIGERRDVLRGLVAFKEELSGTAVFTDHTTLAAVVRLIGDGDGSVMTAGSLLDLDAFIRSAVLFDYVVCLENPLSQAPALINAALGEELVKTVHVGLVGEPSGEGGLVGALSDLFDDVRGALDYQRPLAGSAQDEDLLALVEAWTLIVGRPITLEALQEQKLERRHDWASASYWNLRRLAEAQESDQNVEAHGHWAEFVDESNLRALFNLRVADLLGLAYVPNTSRLPMRHHQMRNAMVAHRHFIDLEEIQRAVNRRTAAYQRPTSVQLPVFLTAALDKASSPQDLWQEAAQLRRGGASYRRHRHELIDALDRGDGRAIDRLHEAVAADSKAWRKSIPAVAGVVATVMATGGGIAALILTSVKLLKVGAELDTEARHNLVRRITRRDEWFLTRLGETAARLVNGLGQAGRIWKAPDWRLDFVARRFKQMKKLDHLWRDPSDLG